MKQKDNQIDGQYQSIKQQSPSSPINAIHLYLTSFAVVQIILQLPFQLLFLTLPPFQSAVVNPIISVFIENFSKIEAIISQAKALITIGLPRIDPELSNKKTRILDW